jgi:trimeric autotransporter adhesin
MNAAFRLVVVLFVGILSLHAQCGLQWLPGDPYGGVNNGVTAATRWDPDGPGPAGERVVFAGSFTVAGSLRANRVASFDPSTGLWSTLGTGMNAPVEALLALPNGDLIAGGYFTQAGGVAVSLVARWSGGAWSSIGLGLPNAGFAVVNALVQLQNGDLVAGGSFFPLGAPLSVARWNGTSWAPLGGGSGTTLNSFVSALSVRSNGDVIAGGLFPAAGGVAAANIARYDGASWSALGSGCDSSVEALCELSNGTLVVGGQFDTAGGLACARIASWNGSAWAPLGTGMVGAVSLDGVYGMAALANGELIVGGRFADAGGSGAQNVARWNGTSWSAIGSGIRYDDPRNSGAFAVATLSSGDLYVGGLFVAAGGSATRNVARWNGSAWSPLAVGTDGWIRAMAKLPNGDLLAGGYFTTIGGVAANGIARRVAGTWQPLGAGIEQGVTAVAVLPNGDVVAGGQFDQAGGVSASRLARWNGANWAPLGGGVSGGFVPEVAALSVHPNGDLIVAGRFTTAGTTAARGIARWDGISWSAFGSGFLFGSFDANVQSIEFLPNGDLVAGGNFTNAGGVAARSIARWNGSAWSAVGGGFALPPGLNTTNVYSLLVAPNGRLWAAGSFSTFGSGGVILQEWNGTAWVQRDAGLTPGVQPTANALALLPNGDVVVGLARLAVPGTGLPVGPNSNSLARWNGSGWAALGTDFDAEIVTSVMQPGGVLEVGGYFSAIGNLVTASGARLGTTCPATLAVAGGGCIGSGGPNVLTAEPAWIGGVFRSRASGLASGSLAVSVYGFSPLALPMPSVHPLGQAGCTLWVDDDILFDFLRGSGFVDSSLAIPTQAALVGGVFYHQVVPVEVDAAGNLSALTSTNALALTIGAF